MASIDDLQGSGVYDDGKGKDGKGNSNGETKGGGGVNQEVKGSGGAIDGAKGGGGAIDGAKGASEAQEVELQGFGWSFEPTSD
ncbi:hypothetical protein [Aliarcobacter cryaerophilus]|uniref:hypothetical protein n=1 Tax=Aliarcobacter cryaerophilus TaxID=28198 RepID=UPI0021B35EEF|nr:hypothetical protein [Aliarcobacter cryaerophilus]MCT7510943.1 hypothetical protein [Aliarcobacter cryaerophilus]